MSAISDQAGVSQGALMHHFPNKNAVTIAAVEYALQSDFERSEVIRKTTETNPVKLVETMFDDLNAFFGSDRFWVALDITMDASKNVEITALIRQTVAQYRRPVYEGWVQKLMEVGLDHSGAEYAVRTSSALISGSAMRSLWADDKDRFEIEAKWHAYILDHIKQQI